MASILSDDQQKQLRDIDLKIKKTQQNKNQSRPEAIRNVLLENNLAVMDAETNRFTLLDDAIIEPLLVKQNVLSAVDIPEDADGRPSKIKSMRIDAATAYLRGVKNQFMQDTFRENVLDCDLETPAQLVNVLRLGEVFKPQESIDFSRQNTRSRSR